MNWRRGLFRLWIVGTVLFVLAVAFVSHNEVKMRFVDILGWWVTIAFGIPLAVLILGASLSLLNGLEPHRPRWIIVPGRRLMMRTGPGER